MSLNENTIHKMNPLSFFNHYDLIGSIGLYKPIVPKKCRFCGEDSDLYFKTDCHLIPELLGKNNFLSSDECDKCNAFFSKYESQLAIMARSFLTMTNTKTKNKTPIFQSRTDFVNQERTTIRVDETTSERLVKANRDDIIIDPEKGIYQIKLRNPGIVPSAVYRALSKIALGIMPISLIDENKDLFEWVLEKKELYQIPHAFQTKLEKVYFKKPSVMLYQARNLLVENQEYLEFVCVVCFANTVIQLYLPMLFYFLKDSFLFAFKNSCTSSYL